MTEDKRAHQRIDGLEQVLKIHIENQSKLEKALAENTGLTRENVENTSEMVALFKGVKGLRSLMMWAAPLVAIVFAVIAYIREWK